MQRGLIKVKLFYDSFLNGSFQASFSLFSSFQQLCDWIPTYLSTVPQQRPCIQILYAQPAYKPDIKSRNCCLGKGKMISTYSSLIVNVMDIL